MRYSSRLFLYAPFVVLLVIAAVAMARWRQIANDWEAKLVAANNGREVAPGVTFHFASHAISGFPFNIDVVLNDFVLTVQSTRGPLSLRSEHFAIHTLTYGRSHQVMEAAGLQNLAWTDAEGGTHNFTFVPGSLRASAIERDGQLIRFDVDLDQFGARPLAGGRSQLHLRASPDRNAVDFILRSDSLRARHSGANLRDIVVAGQMISAAPLSRLFAGRDEWRRALGEWRVSAGFLRLDHIAMDWDGSHVAGNGVLALDEENRLSGRIVLQLSGEGTWQPARLVENAFTTALQQLAGTTAIRSPSSLPLTLDIHNGAAIAGNAGNSRAAGRLEPLF